MGDNEKLEKTALLSGGTEPSGYFITTEILPGPAFQFFKRPNVNSPAENQLECEPGETFSEIQKKPLTSSVGHSHECSESMVDTKSLLDSEPTDRIPLQLQQSQSFSKTLSKPPQTQPASTHAPTNVKLKVKTSPNASFSVYPFYSNSLRAQPESSSTEQQEDVQPSQSVSRVALETNVDTLREVSTQATVASRDTLFVFPSFGALTFESIRVSPHETRSERMCRIIFLVPNLPPLTTRILV